MPLTWTSGSAAPDNSEYNPYDDEEMVPGTENTTPTHREVPEKIPDSARERVNLEVPGGRCLIENVAPNRGVDYAHCFARRKYRNDEDLYTRLEYYWKMRYLSLNLDTRYNIFRAGASLHRMFDANAWMLIPEQSIVKQFALALKSRTKHGGYRPVRAEFPDLKEERFKYRFVPLSKTLMDITIARQDKTTRPAKPSDITIHFFPFDTLPPFESHLHPKFVIYQAGRKLIEAFKIRSPTRNKTEDAETDAANSDRIDFKLRLRDLYPAIEDIERIYQAWMVQPKYDAIMMVDSFKPPVPRPNDGNDNISNKTSLRVSKRPLSGSDSPLGPRTRSRTQMDPFTDVEPPQDRS